MRRNFYGNVLVLAFCFAIELSSSGSLLAEHIETNVVYGMYSGLALLMDVHYPDKPNGYSIVFIPGSGWTAPLAFDAPPLKDNTVGDGPKKLANGGYTVFVINHRATPRFQYPAPLEDAQRAVRFIRSNAATY